MKLILVVAVAMILMATMLFQAYGTWKSCNEKGGVLVKGLFIHECVKPISE